MELRLTQSQNEAIDRLLDAVRRGESVISLSGAAGTGKTTIISHLRDQLDDAVVCTPTNKAAQVLESKGITAATFYKRFYLLLEGDRSKNIKPKFISCRDQLEQWAMERGGEPEKYIKDLGEKRHFAKVIILDEASMVSTRAVREMRKMCKHLILVGDRHQLPPVGDQENPAGYFTSLKPTAELTEVLRQAEGSLILELANEIRLGSDKVRSLLRRFEPSDDYCNWSAKAARTIAFTNKERRRINQISRRIAGWESPLPVMGDRVIGTANVSDFFLNGTEASVLSFDWDGVSQLANIELTAGQSLVTGKMLMTTFVNDQSPAYQEAIGETWTASAALLEKELAACDKDPFELTYGYCLTAHKAQGSEWPSVAVIDQRNLIAKVASNDHRAAMLPEEYVRRWLYTAVTRTRSELAFAPPNWVQPKLFGEAA